MYISKYITITIFYETSASQSSKKVLLCSVPQIGSSYFKDDKYTIETPEAITVHYVVMHVRTYVYAMHGVHPCI
jgi:hypothetical protein